MVPTRRHQRLSAVGGEEPCHPVRVPAKCGEFLPARDVVAVDHSLSRPSENGLLVRRHRKRGDGGGLVQLLRHSHTSEHLSALHFPDANFRAPDDGGHKRFTWIEANQLGVEVVFECPHQHARFIADFQLPRPLGCGEVPSAVRSGLNDIRCESQTTYFIARVGVNEDHFIFAIRDEILRAPGEPYLVVTGVDSNVATRRRWRLGRGRLELGNPLAGLHVVGPDRLANLDAGMTRPEQSKQLLPIGAKANRE